MQMNLLVCNSFPPFLSTWMKLTQAAEKASIVLTQLGKFTLSAQGSVTLSSGHACEMGSEMNLQPVSCLWGMRDIYLHRGWMNTRLLAPLGGVWETRLLFSRMVRCDAWNHQHFCHHEGNPLGQSQETEGKQVLSVIHSQTFQQWQPKDLVLMPDWANTCIIESFDACNLWQLPQVSRKANKSTLAHLFILGPSHPLCQYLSHHHVELEFFILIFILIKSLGRHTWTLY